MKHLKTPLIVISAVLLLLTLLVSCNKAYPILTEKSPVVDSSIGSPVIIGYGTAQTFIKKGEDNQISQLGIEFKPSAMNGVLGFGPDIDKRYDYTLPMPKGYNQSTVIKHIVLKWNPINVANAAVQPYFDFLFYTIDSTKRQAISNITDTASLKYFPRSNLIPDHYKSSVTEDKIGKRWCEYDRNRINARKAANHFIYGTYLEDIVFMGPAFKAEALALTDTITAAIPLPLLVDQTGLYPTKYVVYRKKENGNYVVLLTQFMHRKSFL